MAYVCPTKLGRNKMVFKPVCCECGQEIRPYHLFYMPTPGRHICIPCSEKKDPEEEKRTADDDG